MVEVDCILALVVHRRGAGYEGVNLGPIEWLKEDVVLDSI